jgi:hypothetical protein
VTRALCRRCTSLQQLRCDVEFGINSRRSATSYMFKGQGITSAERCASMQRQLALLLPSTGFLAPSSWPSSSCLTSLTVDGDQQCTAELAAAMATTTLEHLDLHQVSADNLPILENISNLSRLTRLGIRAAEPDIAAPASIAEAIATLTALRHLTIGAQGIATPLPDEVEGSVPRSWTQLQQLSSLTFASCRVALQPLAALQQLVELNVNEFCAARGSLCALFPLTRLTSLDCPEDLVTGIEDEEAEGGGQQLVVAMPAAWRQHLRHLKWSCLDSRLLPSAATQLTALDTLELAAVSVTPQLCRCEL